MTLIPIPIDEPLRCRCVPNGAPTKANTKLGWTPKYDLQMLVTDMVQSDLHLMRKEEYLKQGGFETLNYFE